MLARRRQDGQGPIVSIGLNFSPPNSSRLVFSIPELVAAILNQWGDDQSGLRKWTALARVNKLLFMMVTPKIWESIDDLSHFVKLVPTDLLEPPNFDPYSDDYVPHFSALRKVETGDLDRYLFYTSFVKQVYIHKDQKCVKQKFTDLMAHWIQATGTEVYHFPNLQHLSITRSTWIPTKKYLDYIKPPSLQSLELHNYTTWKHDLNPSQIIALFPNLEFVTVHGSTYGRNEFTQQMQSALLHLPTLRTLTIGLSMNALSHFFGLLSEMPSFQALTVDIDLAAEQGVIPSARPLNRRKPPVLLNELTLCAHHMNAFIAGFNTAKEANLMLEHVGGFMAFPATPTDIYMLLEKLSGDFTDISTLVFEDALAPGLKESWKRNESGIQETIISPAHLQPLTELRLLTVLKLRTRGIMVITGNLLEILGTNCPGLTTCILSPDNRVADTEPANPESVTLMDVVKFASKCSRLVSLGIRMDARRQELLKERLPLPILSYLDVGSSSIDDAAYVVEILRQAFPFLHTLVWAPGAPNKPSRMSSEENEQWFAVMQVLFS